jgi:hypothetical protein
MHNLTKRLLIALAVVFAFLVIWRRVRIVFLVTVGFWQLALLFVILAVAIYVIFELVLGGLNDR